MLNNNHYQNELDMPLGLSMALSQNPMVLGMFTSLTPDQRETLVHSVRDRDGEGSSVITGGGKAHRDFHRYD